MNYTKFKKLKMVEVIGPEEEYWSDDEETNLHLGLYHPSGMDPIPGVLVEYTSKLSEKYLKLFIPMTGVKFIEELEE